MRLAHPMAPGDEPLTLSAAAARGVAAAASRLLAAWGDFPAPRRQSLVDRIGAASAARMAASPHDINDAVREGVDRLLSAWAAALGRPGAAMAVDDLRAAFLAIDGARHWPDAFLETPPPPAFAAAVRRALPRPLPPPAPLDMPEQAL